jgi:hypothetical protein
VLLRLCFIHIFVYIIYIQCKTVYICIYVYTKRPTLKRFWFPDLQCVLQRQTQVTQMCQMHVSRFSGECLTIHFSWGSEKCHVSVPYSGRVRIIQTPCNRVCCRLQGPIDHTDCITRQSHGIWGSQGGEAFDFSLLGSYLVQTCRYVNDVLKNILPPSSVLKMETECSSNTRICWVSIESSYSLLTHFHAVYIVHVSRYTQLLLLFHMIYYWHFFSN